MHGARRILLVLALTGCAATAPKPRSIERRVRGDFSRDGFPSPAMLARIKARPEARPEARIQTQPQTPAKTPERPNAGEVDHWALAGPLPASPLTAPHPNLTPYDALLDQLITARKNALSSSAQLNCAARELGRFVLKHGVRPPPPLMSFITGRCGATVAELRITWLLGQVPKEAGDRRIFEEWRWSFSGILASWIGRNQVLGVWYGREDDRAIAFIAGGERRVTFESITTAQEQTIVRGRLELEAERIRALINRGRSSVSECRVDPTKVLPSFELQCPHQNGGDETWLELAAFERGRPLAETAASVLLQRGTTEFTIAATEHTSNAAELFTAINRMRAENALPPLALDVRQSEEAAALAPHYFAAIREASTSSIADAIALGLRAGWNVDALVRSGLFTSMSSTHFDTASLRPFGRETLLDPHARRIAIGVGSADAGETTDTTHATDTQALIATYAIVDPGAHTELRDRALAALNRARSEAGAKPLRIVASLDRLAREAGELLENGELEPQRALDHLTQQAQLDYARQVHALLIRAGDSSALVFPKEAFDRSKRSAGLALVPYRAPDEAWAHDVLLVVLAELDESELRKAGRRDMNNPRDTTNPGR